MSTPRRFSVVLIDTYAATQIRRTVNDMDGAVYVQQSDKTQWIGDFTEDTSVYWCNDANTAKALVNQLTGMFPRNSYAICKTEDVYHVPTVPTVHARFTDQGLMPA
jgi:hypothetical protein